MKNALIVLFCIIGYFATAQKEDSISKDVPSCTHTCEGFHCCTGASATFEDGINAFRKELQSYISTPSYLKGERRTMIISFIIDEKGIIGHFKIIKSIDKQCDEIGLKALEKMQKYKWSPAITFVTPCKTKPIKDRRSLPIIFQ